MYKPDTLQEFADETNQKLDIFLKFRSKRHGGPNSFEPDTVQKLEEIIPKLETLLKLCDETKT